MLAALTAVAAGNTESWAPTKEYINQYLRVEKVRRQAPPLRQFMSKSIYFTITYILLCFLVPFLAPFYHFNPVILLSFMRPSNFIQP